MTLANGDFVLPMKGSSGETIALPFNHRPASGGYLIKGKGSDGVIVAAGLNPMNAVDAYGYRVLCADEKVAGLGYVPDLYLGCCDGDDSAEENPESFTLSCYGGTYVVTPHFGEIFPITNCHYYKNEATFWIELFHITDNRWYVRVYGGNAPSYLSWLASWNTDVVDCSVSPVGLTFHIHPTFPDEGPCIVSL